ncbi:hypothetical protein ACFCVO_02295 [Agromyces sp. NPDC056379]|uniref:hypothetical protein n=2 Tax=unclassified Agromyces TaxID=2639701 RepID=UPI0035E35E3F
MRERERLLEQQEPSATPDAAGQTLPVPDTFPPVAPQPPVQPAPVQSMPAPAAPVHSMPAQPVPAQSVPAPALPVSAASPAYAAPRPAGGFGEPGVAFPAAPPITTPQQSPFAPRPVIPAPAPAAPAPVQSPADAASYPRAAAAQPQSAPERDSSEATTPERTLTRRELRAMLDGNQLDEFDFEDDEIDGPAPQSQQPTPAAASFPVAGGPVHPVRPDGDIASPSPAVGHWTSQLNAPVESAEPFDQLLSRGGVSHGVPTTTNALILPTLPDHGSLGGTPLAASGEIIATGSIDLPRSYGATGVHPSRIDSSDVDRLFDQIEEAGTGAAPVAATRAISTQGAARAMIAPPKKEGMNVPLVLAVTAGVLALGVVATLVIGAVAGLF